jgi:methane monooxygenase PmoA-like
VGLTWTRGGIAVAALATGLAWAEDPLPDVRLTVLETERRVVVTADGEFTSYIWPERLRKPVLFPLYAADRTVVTRGYPLDPRPGERVDHPHHVGLWLNHGDVNGLDFWNNSDVIPAAEAAKYGTIVHRKIDRARGGRGRGELAVTMDWVTPQGKTLLTETTTFVFHARRGSRMIDRSTTLTAHDRPVVFRDSKEGMLGLRVARALEQPSEKAEVYTDASGRPSAVPKLDNTGVAGLFRSSEGKEADAVWATRARWVSLSGTSVKLAILDHPDNPSHPTYWHARGYGLFAANPFGHRAYSGGKEQLDYTLAPGASVRLRHRVLILSGAGMTSDLDAEFRAFAVGDGPDRKQGGAR